jgi:hypothetical protein
MYDSDGVKSSTRDSDAEIEDSDGFRSTRASSRSSNYHSSRRQAQIQQAASVRQAQRLASNTSANSRINYRSSNTGGGSSNNANREPCKNCKSTSHGTKWCPSPKCYEKNCGKTFAFADERKAHFIQEHEFTSKPTTSPLKSSLKDGKGKKVKFLKSQRLVGKVHRVQTKTPKHQPANDSEDNSNSSFGSDSSRSVEAAPRELIWRNDTCSSNKGRKVSHLRNVSTIHSVRKRIMTSPMQSHHQDRRQPCHQLQHRLDKHHHCHLQPRQRSRHHRHSRTGYNDQQTQRRQDAAGRRSTTGPVKRNRDQDSRTNTSPLLTSTHAEQSFRVSDSPLESRNGIAIAYQMKNSLSYQLRRVSCGSAILEKQYSRHTFMTLIKTKKIFTTITWYTTHHDAEASGHRGHTP